MRDPVFSNVHAICSVALKVYNSHFINWDTEALACDKLLEVSLRVDK